MPHVRMLALDVDGTLLNSRDELTPEVARAVRRAVQGGLHVVLATGRRYGRVLHLVEPLALDLPLITASGALIKRPSDHATLFRAELAEQLVARLVRHIAEAGYDPLVYADTHGQGFEFYYPRAEVPQAELAEFLEKNTGLGRLLPGLVSDPPRDVFGLFAMGPQDEMLRLERRLQAAFPAALSTHVLRSPLYRGWMCEVAPAGVDKGFAVRQLAEQWSIDRAEICAVGDDVNDLPMFRAAGLSVAMQNALPIVRQSAQYVIPSNDQHGVAHLIDALLSGDEIPRAE